MRARCSRSTTTSRWSRKTSSIPVPMLISTPLINGYEVADLQPDRSLVRNLLNEGIDVYMINWGYPKRTDRFNDVDDYVTDFIDDIVDHVIEDASVDKMNLFGICMGGTMATCYSALHPEKVRNLVLTVTPIDFHQARGRRPAARRPAVRDGASSANVDAMVDAFGNVPADVLNVSFLMASPFTLMFGKYADTIDLLDNKEALLNFLRMEKWLFGGPDVAGEAYRQFVKEFIQKNKLVKRHARSRRPQGRPEEPHDAGPQRLRRARSPGAAAEHGGAGRARRQQGGLQGAADQDRPYRHLHRRRVAENPGARRRQVAEGALSSPLPLRVVSAHRESGARFLLIGPIYSARASGSRTPPTAAVQGTPGLIRAPIDRRNSSLRRQASAGSRLVVIARDPWHRSCRVSHFERGFLPSLSCFPVKAEDVRDRLLGGISRSNRIC